MAEYRFPIILVLALIGALCFAPGLSIAQQRPGIRTSVDPPAGCFADDSVDVEDVYSFVRIQIKALAFARDGERANHDLLTASGGPPINNMAHLLAGLRQERIENTCAGFVITPYAESRNEYIASAAKYLVHSFDEFGNITDQMLRLTLMETMRQRAGGSTEEELAQLKSRRQELLSYLPVALDASLALLLDSRLDSNGKHDHLILTSVQRNELLKYLDSQFPVLKSGKAEKNPGDFTPLAGRIESFLSGKYKPSDQ